MVAYENDTLVIPEKYKKMSVSEIKIEKKKVLGKLLSSDRPKKVVRKNKNNITFKF
jgi:ribosomal protein L7Ae-like RNA K-turn-binding protein